MVKMALHKLSEEQIVELDEEKKAAMVSNLLVGLWSLHVPAISQAPMPTYIKKKSSYYLD